MAEIDSDIKMEEGSSTDKASEKIGPVPDDDIIKLKPAEKKTVSKCALFSV